jgi:hypothetical protein
MAVDRVPASPERQWPLRVTDAFAALRDIK